MRTRNWEAGQSMVLVAVSLIVLIGMLGLAIDVGYLHYVRRELQTAADAAALAGAMDVYYNTVQTAGLAAASENGFAGTCNASPTSVCIYNPPIDGPYASSTYPTYVEAVVKQKNVRTFFSSIFGVSSVTLSASSVAAGGNNCIYGLDQNAGGALNLTIAVVSVPCGVVSNNTVNYFGGLLCAPSIQVVNLPSGGAGGSCTMPFRAARPVKISAVADPFAFLGTGPSYTAPPNVPPTCNPPNCFTTALVVSAATTISQLPVYEGGIQITNVPVGQVVTVNSGTYFGSAAGAPAFQITNSTVVFNSGTYHIVSRTAGTPAINLIKTAAGNTNQVSFGAGTYHVYGGIKDIAVFGSSVNWNSTAGTPSLFNIWGGGLTLIGGSGSTTGSVGQSSGGVTFFNSGTAGAGLVTSYGPIVSYFSFAGAFCGSNCQLSAPTSGLYPGILFFEDPNNTATTSCGFGGVSGACFNASITGGGKISHAGAYYFPKAKVGFNFDFGGNAPYTFLVANDVSWFLNFTFNTDYSSLPNGSPLKMGSAVLVQ
jgi:Flp pilus assembly protein TadG